MRGNKGILAIAIVAALAMAITTAAATAGTSSGTAVAAKKKCKKKKQADSAKKKKCKKKRAATPAPLVRATLQWTEAGSDDADLDLFVFDANGLRNGNGNLAIPITSMSPDVHGPSGTETFTDLDFNTRRVFSFGVCYQVGGSVHAPFTITYVTADGVTHTANEDPGSSFHYDYPGGAPIPSGYCPD
jgi:hypothetical protein